MLVSVAYVTGVLGLCLVWFGVVVGMLLVCCRYGCVCVCMSLIWAFPVVVMCWCALGDLSVGAWYVVGMCSVWRLVPCWHVVGMLLRFGHVLRQRLLCCVSGVVLNSCAGVMFLVCCGYALV